MRSYADFLKKFPTEKELIDIFIRTQFGDNNPLCKRCGCIQKIYHINKRPKMFYCNNCETNFSAFTNTLFEHSATDLRKWFYAFNHVINNEKKLSGYKLLKEINVTYKTAWRMLTLIRESLEDPAFSKLIREIDRKYIQ